MLVITGGYGFSIVGFINQLTTGSGYSNPILLVCLVLSHLCPTYPMYEPDWILLAIELSLHLIATRPNRPICSQKKLSGFSLAIEVFPKIGVRLIIQVIRRLYVSY